MPSFARPVELKLDRYISTAQKVIVPIVTVKGRRDVPGGG